MQRSCVRAVSVLAIASAAMLTAASPAAAGKPTTKLTTQWISSVVDVQPGTGCTRTMTASFTRSGKAFTFATLSVNDPVQGTAPSYNTQNYTGRDASVFSWTVTLQPGSSADGFVSLQFVNGIKQDAGTIPIPAFSC
ncbi:MAG: hypothetical protein QOG60_1283 [Frankiaceae bacterium]|nr:hypothetical protein [Frankiaceae bacterium]